MGKQFKDIVLFEYCFATFPLKFITRLFPIYFQQFVMCLICHKILSNELHVMVLSHIEWQHSPPDKYSKIVYCQYSFVRLYVCMYLFVCMYCMLNVELEECLAWDHESRLRLFLLVYLSNKVFKSGLGHSKLYSWANLGALSLKGWVVALLLMSKIVWH